MIESKKAWKQICLPAEATLEQGIRILNASNLRLVLVVARGWRLLGTVSDGDIRRGLLRGLQLSNTLGQVMHRRPLVVSPSMELTAVLEIMRINRIYQVPVVDEKKTICGVHAWERMDKPSQRQNAFVIMAGGRGSRMMPFTETCPKPMLLVDGKPMLEHIVVRAREAGFRDFFLCINYLGGKVERYFRNGDKWGVKIRYVKEKTPLGTAGAIGLLPGPYHHPLLVTNGDVLTDVNYGDLVDFHEKHQGFATMAVQLHRWEHPFGVVEFDGVEIQKIQEKPLSQAHVNAGIYVLSPHALRALPRNRAIHMPDFFVEMKKRKKRLLAYPLHEPWLDVGRPSDLFNAQKKIKKKMCPPCSQ